MNYLCSKVRFESNSQSIIEDYRVSLNSFSQSRNFSFDSAASFKRSSVSFD